MVSCALFFHSLLQAYSYPPFVLSVASGRPESLSKRITCIYCPAAARRSRTGSVGSDSRFQEKQNNLQTIEPLTVAAVRQIPSLNSGLSGNLGAIAPPDGIHQLFDPVLL